MAILNQIILDEDGAPPAGGLRQVNFDYDTVALAMTLLHFQNTTSEDCVFTITRDSDQHAQTVNLPAGTQPGTLAPPFTGFPGGPWTPAMQPNSDGGQPFIASGWSVARSTSAPHRR